MLQLPARYTPPLSEDFPTDGKIVADLIELVWKTPENPEGIKLDEWQRWLLDRLLERYPEGHELAGRLRWRQVTVSMGRQNGKSLISAALALWGMLVQYPSGSSVISLASNLDQARIIYNRVLYAIQSNPYLSKRFRKASESRGIVTADGSGRYDVKPAKESAVQGIPMTLCLLDELHLAADGMWGAAIQAIKSFDDGMVIGITTAGDQNSEQLIELYRIGDKAIAGDPEFDRFGFFVWEAPTNSKIDDPEAIMAANPAVAAGRIPIDRVMSDSKMMQEHEVRRYVLNQFISGTYASWMPSDVFAKAGTKSQAPQHGGVFAVDRTSKYEHASIVYANEVDGEHHSELVQSFVNPSEMMLFNALVKLYQTYQPRAIVLDDGHMPGLGKRLKLNGIPVYQMWGKEMKEACAVVYQLIATGKGKHNNDPLVKAQSAGAVPVFSQGQWLIDRAKSLGDVDALVATIMALYVSTRAENTSIGVF